VNKDRVHGIYREIHYLQNVKQFHGPNRKSNFIYGHNKILMWMWFSVGHKIFHFTDKSIPGFYDGGAQIFQKSRNHFKFLSTNKKNWSRFHIQDPKMLGATTQHLVSPGILTPMVYDIILATRHQFTSNFKLHAHFGSHPPPPPSPPPPPPTSSSCQSEC
jgi:hypothetical protein